MIDCLPWHRANNPHRCHLDLPLTPPPGHPLPPFSHPHSTLRPATRPSFSQALS
ncbi:hypothetical protein BaRGS_00026385, partial [Batillaria attramentaria]